MKTPSIRLLILSILLLWTIILAGRSLKAVNDDLMDLTIETGELAIRLDRAEERMQRLEGACQ